MTPDLPERNRRPRMSRAGRRRALLEAAAHVVATEGPSALTMERLAVAAEVTKSIVYMHFENRSAVLLELMDENAAKLDTVLSNAFAGTPDFEKAMADAARAFFDVIADSPMLPLLGEYSGDEVVEAHRRDRRAQATKRWSAVFQQRFGLSEPVADTATSMLLAGVEGGAQRWLEGGADRALVEHVIVRMTTLLLHDLAPESHE